MKIKEGEVIDMRLVSTVMSVTFFSCLECECKDEKNSKLH